MGEVAYDGFGNPVGLAFLAPLAAKFAPTALKALPGIFRGARSAIRRFVPAARAFQRALPAQYNSSFLPLSVPTGSACSGPTICPGSTSISTGYARTHAGTGEAEFAEVPYPMTATPFMRPPPPGWIPRPSPYTGLQPRPVYMRCLVWRGPRGLVPARAAQTPPAVAPSAAVALQQARARGIGEDSEESVADVARSRAFMNVEHTNDRVFLVSYINLTTCLTYQRCPERFPSV